jgi:multiple sugar transport system permease protein
MLARGAAEGLRLAVRSPGLDLARSRSACGLWLSAGAAGIIASSSLPDIEPRAGSGMPVVWPVMPFSAWASLVLSLVAAVRLAQAALALNAAERRGRLRSGAFCLAGAGALFVWFRASGDSLSLLKGTIELSMSSSIALLSLAVGGFFAIGGAYGASARLGFARRLATHAALVAGSAVFGLPFVWLLITSFKEDRDMSSPTGIVWVPRVTRTVPHLDPENPLVETEFEGQTVQGTIVERLPDGSARLDIVKPLALRGMYCVAKPPLRFVPGQATVVAGALRGRRIEGKVVRELDDGRREVEVLKPADLAGERYIARHDEVDPVRSVGLRVQNYTDALEFLPPETHKGLVYLKNTLLLVVLNVIGTLISSSIVAYAFARLRFPGRNALFLLVLSTMMLPSAVTLLPQFLIFRWLGWIDTLNPLWVPAFLGSAFNIFLLRQFFLTIPMELEDAAKIDGSSYLRTYWQVMLPQIRPALAVVAIWTFMGAWNNFMGPLVYVNSPENMPISYALQLYQGDRGGEPGLLMAFATMTMAPVLAVFFFAQKYFIEGVTLSGFGGR